MEDLHQAIVSLTDIARTLKRRRTLAGAVELDSVEVKVQLNEEKGAIKIENLVPKQVRTHVQCIYMYVYMYMYVSMGSIIHLCVHVDVHVHVYADTHTHTHTHTHTPASRSPRHYS